AATATAGAWPRRLGGKSYTPKRVTPSQQAEPAHVRRAALLADAAAHRRHHAGPHVFPGERRADGQHRRARRLREDPRGVSRQVVASHQDVLLLPPAVVAMAGLLPSVSAVWVTISPAVARSLRNQPFFTTTRICEVL